MIGGKWWYRRCTLWSWYTIYRRCLKSDIAYYSGLTICAAVAVTGLGERIWNCGAPTCPVIIVQLGAFGVTAVGNKVLS